MTKFLPVPVINLSGKMSKLGVSRLSPAVIKAISEAATHFYVMDELYEAAERVIAQKFNAPSVYLAHSAAAGIFQVVSAHQALLTNRKVRVVLPASHHIDFGMKVKTLLELAGAEVLSIGTADSLKAEDLKNALSLKPDLAMFITSHYVTLKSEISAASYASFYQSYNISVIHDAAAEVDIVSALASKANYVIISGSKALSGPTSGLVFTHPLLHQALVNLRSSAARISKVAKENVLGIVAAVEEYTLTSAKTPAEKAINEYLKALQQLGYDARLKEDAKRGISRIEVHHQKISDLAKALHERQIYTREYGLAEHYLELDLRQVSLDEMKVVINTFKELSSWFI